MSEMSEQDDRILADAVRKLEGQSFAMMLANKVGVPVEALMRMLPEKAQGAVGTAVNRALEQCLKVAVMAPANGSVHAPRKRAHTVLTAASGAVGGFFGLPGLVVELPVTTTVMLHSIVEIARSHGEDMREPESALSCLEVLAMGKDGRRNDAVESAYYATRAALATATRDAAAYIARKGLAKEGAPAVVGFLSKIAARFGLEVSEKAAAQAIPVAGAVGGAALNVMFMGYFQRLAEGHFAVRELERRYGSGLVRAEFERVRAGGFKR